MSGILCMGLGGKLATLVLDISNTFSPDIPARLSAAGWLGIAQPVRIVNTALVNTLVIPSSLSGADITIANAAGARIGGTSGGGTALRTQVAIKVDNLGTLSGGGGVGGAGRSVTIGRTGPTGWQTATANGSSGVSGTGFSSGLTIYKAGAVYESQTVTLPDTGGFPPNRRGLVTLVGGYGHPGGDWGQDGDPGGMGTVTGDYDAVEHGPATVGQPAGYYIDGNALVTWINTGTRLGRVR